MVSSALEQGGHHESSYRHRRVSDIPRLVAWRRQLVQAHERLRLALRTAQQVAMRRGLHCRTSTSSKCFDAFTMVRTLQRRRSEPMTNPSELPIDPAFHRWIARYDVAYR